MPIEYSSDQMRKVKTFYLANNYNIYEGKHAFLMFFKFTYKAEDEIGSFHRCCF